ncbi:hypothetical protein BC828DRAFT_90795 [Blastocladiella britannica]|nr:hypothetical protein BC828DRAFT_90795 [Blastocladiella britannica]
MATPSLWVSLGALAPLNPSTLPPTDPEAVMRPSRAQPLRGRLASPLKDSARSMLPGLAFPMRTPSRSPSFAHLFLDFGAFTVNPGVSPVAPPVNSTTPLPMLVTLDTNVSGMRFVSGTPFTGTGQSKGPLFVEVNFGLQRSKITIGFSLFILGINWILSLVVGFLALQVLVNKRPVAAAVLGPPISLMFALPSLRNVQPQAPPIGSTNDVLGFFWNMVIVSLSAIAIIFAFVNRWSPPAKEAPVIPPRPSRRPSERAVDEWQLSPIHSPQSTGPRLTDKEGY